MRLWGKNEIIVEKRPILILVIIFSHPFHFPAVANFISDFLSRPPLKSL